MPPKLSVITVCLNSADTIGDTLASIADQTFEDIEHIVIDGGSTDGTQALVQAARHPVARFLSERDGGIYDAMNRGIEMATGDVVGFLNSDDTFASSNSVARLAAAFERGVEACYGDVVYVSPEDTRRVIRYWRAGQYEQGLCASGWAPPHPTLYVRRDTLARVGGFDTRMRIAADFEFALRLLDVEQVPVRYVPEVLVRMRAGGVSNRNLRGIIRGHRELAQALRSHGFPAGWWWSVRRIARRIPQFIHRP